MKKIPTLFEREYDGHRKVGIKPELSDPSLQWVLDGEGEATLKLDGACCAILDGKFYRRYDAKKGKQPPEGAIPCCHPDPVTGHWPHWVRVDPNNPADKWFDQARNSRYTTIFTDGTYEAVGKHFNGNPYNLDFDYLVPHGKQNVYVERDFESISEWLNTHESEGIVFWLNDEPVCKIKRTDFGYEWPIKKE